MTISTKTESGTSESTTRNLEEANTTESMRIDDYFVLMRKWCVGLYRYCLRMTYEITIPKAAVAMREIYKERIAIKTLLNVLLVYLSSLYSTIQIHEMVNLLMHPLHQKNFSL